MWGNEKADVGILTLLFSKRPKTGSLDTCSSSNAFLGISIGGLWTGCFFSGGLAQVDNMLQEAWEGFKVGTGSE